MSENKQLFDMASLAEAAYADFFLEMAFFKPIRVRLQNNLQPKAGPKPSRRISHPLPRNGPLQYARYTCPSRGCSDLM